MFKYLSPFKKPITLFLIILDLLLLIKLKFFIPQLSGTNEILDFDTYFKLTSDLIHGINPYTVSYMQSLGPPSIFFYFLPFTIFKLPIARTLFTIINISAGILTCYITAKYYFKKNPVNWFLLLGLIYFSSFPVRFSIEMGQPNLIVSLLISLILAGLYKSKKSFVVFLMILIKTNFVMVLPFLFKKHLNEIIKIFLFLILAILILSPFIKLNWYKYYIDHKLPNFQNINTVNTSLNYYNQSIQATLMRFNIAQYRLPIYLIISLIFIFLIYKLESFPLGVVASVVLSPVSWQHYYVVLFPIFILIFMLMKKKPLYLGFLITSIFLWWIEIPKLHTAPINVVNSILASHYFVSAIILGILIIRSKFAMKHNF